MIAGLYAISYTGVLLSTLWWFYRTEKDKGTGLATGLFFLCVLLYVFALLLGDGGLIYTAIIALRDFGIFVFVALLANSLASRPTVFAVFSAAILAGIVFFYFGILRHTFSVENTILSANAEFLIDIKSPDDSKAIETALAEYGIRIERAYPGKHETRHGAFRDNYIVDIPPEHLDKLEDIRAALLATGMVDWIDHNEIISLDPIPNNSDFVSTQKDFGLNDQDVDRLWGFEAMNMEAFYKALRNVRPAKTAKIAILDTGVDAEHEDLKDNFESSDAKSDTDRQGHGTHCAGIAGAVSNNRIGIASQLPDNSFAVITSIKVLSDQGFGSQRRIIEGIIEAADAGADVISMSLGGPSDDAAQKAYQEAVEYAVKTSGAIVVVAAGNSAEDAMRHAPASTPGVIVVSALDEQLDKADFSNSVANIAMGIAAPGVNIYSTFPGNEYTALNGTSMATPYVASLLGIMKAIRPRLNAQQAYDILHSTGRKTDGGSETGRFIQPAKAVEALR